MRPSSAPPAGHGPPRAARSAGRVVKTSQEQALGLRRGLLERDLLPQPGQQFRLVHANSPRPWSWPTASGAPSGADRPALARESLSLFRARFIRDRTVPVGTPSAAAASV